MEALRGAGASRLWPALPLLKGKPGNYFSSWFNTTQREAPEGQRKLPYFHSFRNTARSKLASMKVSEPMINVLVSHEVGGSEGARTYTHRTADDLREAIESLSYSVTLPRVYKAPAMVAARPKRRQKA